jgi:outer membrane protein
MNAPCLSLRRTLLSAAAGLALAGLGGTAAAQTTIKLGYSHVEPHSSATDAVGPFLPTPVSGVSLSVKNQDTLFISVARAVTEQVEVEFALGYPPTHDVVAKLNPAIVSAPVVNAYQGQTVAKVRQLAPTLFVNYRFGDAASAWRPFVGLGVNYTRFDKRTSTAAGNGLNGGPTDIRLDDSWGLAAQVGVGYKVNAQWSVNAALATAQVKTTLTTTTAGATRTLDIKFRPQVFTLAVGYSF